MLGVQRHTTMPSTRPHSNAVYHATDNNRPSSNRGRSTHTQHSSSGAAHNLNMRHALRSVHAWQSHPRTDSGQIDQGHHGTLHDLGMRGVRRHGAKQWRHHASAKQPHLVLRCDDPHMRPAMHARHSCRPQCARVHAAPWPRTPHDAAP